MISKNLKIKLLLLNLFLYSSILYASSRIMPNEVNDIINSLNYVTVDDFYERDGIVDPPFVYGVVKGDKENSVAFWCKEKNAEIFILVLAVKRNTSWETEKIMKTDNTPMGLSISTVKDYSLDGFHDVKTRKEIKNKKDKYTGIILKNESLGLQDIFIKYNNQWIMKAYD